MTTFQVLVVDDEPRAREVAVNLLRRDTEVKSVTECEDGR
jgi:CheY-like chemotaxis protein